ncbi:hypothetical protein RHSIM_Rhsim05G0115900 [Rhododendron simsii]|uniref:NADPH-dependent pterin aldehyde reductase n=1 Tax=Rhododendron simsii TaxID=118357 RepID=A0A834GYB3_RHOSS|nr:hypothetical protein RHSIM_Rhsim05G0115900 [Rhododendron simsii]
MREEQNPRKSWDVNHPNDPMTEPKCSPMAGEADRVFLGLRVLGLTRDYSWRQNTPYSHGLPRSNSSVEELARAVVEKKGVPDIIVNNAGTINRNNRLWEVPVEEFDTVIDINVKGVANMLRHFIPLMIERKQGIIVNMSSGWGRSAAAQVAPYCASKWAVEGLTRSVAKELPSGMAIVALNPGVINTDMLTSCFGSSSSLYQTPESWAPKAATMILNLTIADNGASLSV